MRSATASAARPEDLARRPNVLRELRTWPRGDALLDATNALAFSTVTCAVLTVAA